MTRRVSGWRRSRRAIDAEDSVLIDGEVVDLVALAGEFVGEGGDRGVFDVRDDNPVTRGQTAIAARPGSLEKTSDGEIVRFGAAAGEKDRVGVAAGDVRAHELADPFAGILQAAAGAAAEFVLAGGVQAAARRSRRASPRSLPAAAAWWRCGRDRSAGAGMNS